jgi:hypothetical protein
MTATNYERKHLAIFKFLTSETIPEVVITIPETKYCLFHTDKGIAYLYNVQIKSDKKILIVHFWPNYTILLHIVSKESLHCMSYILLKEKFLNDSDSIASKSEYDYTLSNQREFELWFHGEFQNWLPKPWKMVARIVTV